MANQRSTLTVGRTRIGSRLIPVFQVALLVFLSLPGWADASPSFELPTAPKGGVVSTEAYVPDPTFNGGLYYPDVFAGVLERDYIGRKVVRLPNGDVVVAGVVPATAGGTGLLNLGLIRYNSEGVRVPWVSPGPFGYFNNEYVVFPNTGDPLAFEQVVNVLDMKLFGTNLYILTEKKYPGSDTDTRVLVFGTNGAYRSQTTVFGTSLDEYAGGLIVYESSEDVVRVIVVGSTFNGVWRPSFRTGTVGSGSSITFAPVVYPNPGNYCPSNRGCVLRSIAAGGAFAAGPPTRFYLGGNRQSAIPDNGNWNYTVMSVDMMGSPNTTFNGSGVQDIAFDRGRDNYDDVRAIVVRPDFFSGVINGYDEIFAVGNVNRACRSGVGIAKLKQDGSLDAEFGDEVSPGGPRNGLVVMGGSSLPGGANCPSQESVFAGDAALSGSGLGTVDGYLNGKIGIAGYLQIDNTTGCAGGCAEDRYESVLYVLKTRNGAPQSANFYPYLNFPGSPTSARHTVLSGITASGPGSFTVSGTARFRQNPGQPAGNTQFVTRRLINDTIFRDGLDND